MSSDTEETKVGAGGGGGGSERAADDQGSDVGRDAEPSASLDADRRARGDVDRENGGGGGDGDDQDRELAATPQMRDGQRQEHEALRLKWREASRMRRIIATAIPDAGSRLPGCAPRSWRPARVESAADPLTVRAADVELDRATAIFRAQLPACNRCCELECVPGGWVDAAIRCGAPEPGRLSSIRRPLPHADDCEIGVALVAASTRTLAVLGDRSWAPERLRESFRRYLAGAPLPLPRPACVDRAPRSSASSTASSASASSRSVERDGRGDQEAGDGEYGDDRDHSVRGRADGWDSGVGPYMAVQLIHEGESIDAYRPWHEATRLLQCANLALESARKTATATMTATGRRLTDDGATGGGDDTIAGGVGPIPAPLFATVREALQYAAADDAWENHNVRLFAFGSAADDDGDVLKRTVRGRRDAVTTEIATEVKRLARVVIATRGGKKRKAAAENKGPTEGDAEAGGGGSSGGGGGNDESESKREANDARPHKRGRIGAVVVPAAAAAAAAADAALAIGRPKKSIGRSNRRVKARCVKSDAKSGGGENGDTNADRDEDRGSVVAKGGGGDGAGDDSDAEKRCLERVRPMRTQGAQVGRQQQQQRSARKLAIAMVTAAARAMAADESRKPSSERVMYSPGDLAARRARVRQMISARRASREFSAVSLLPAPTANGDAVAVCVSDLVRFWDPRTLQVVVEVRVGSGGREFRTRHRPDLSDAISERRVRGPVACAAVRCVFTCARMHNLYCVVDIGALDRDAIDGDGTEYAAYCENFEAECRLHLARPDRLVARPLVDLVLAYLPLWMPTREPERVVSPPLPREFSADAVATLIARHAGN